MTTRSVGGSGSTKSISGLSMVATLASRWRDLAGVAVGYQPVERPDRLRSHRRPGCPVDLDRAAVGYQRPDRTDELRSHRRPRWPADPGRAAVGYQRLDRTDRVEMPATPALASAGHPQRRAGDVGRLVAHQPGHGV